MWGYLLFIPLHRHLCPPSPEIRSSRLVWVNHRPWIHNILALYDAELGSLKEESTYTWKTVYYLRGRNDGRTSSSDKSTTRFHSHKCVLYFNIFGERRRTNWVCSHCSCVLNVWCSFPEPKNLSLELRGHRCACHGCCNIRDGVFFGSLNFNLIWMWFGCRCGGRGISQNQDIE